MASEEHEQKIRCYFFVFVNSLNITLYFYFSGGCWCWLDEGQENISVDKGNLDNDSGFFYLTIGFTKYSL